MGISIETLVASKKFTSETVLGGGAVVGKNVTVSSINPIDGGNRVTFSYTLDDGTVKTSTMDVMDGVDGQPGEKGEPGYTPQKNVDYFDGVSPTVTVTKEGKIATITCTDINGTTTATISDGKDGQGGSGGSAEVPIEKIKVNGELQTPVNKVVDITVPSIEGLTKDADLATVAKSGSYEDLSNKPTIPSLDGYAKTSEIPTKVSELENDSNYLSSIPEEYVTYTELDAKGYLTEHQDISGKVDKVEGKSLISDTEIARLATVDNYDDTAIKAEIAKKADTILYDKSANTLYLKSGSTVLSSTEIKSGGGGATITPKPTVNPQIENGDSKVIITWEDPTDVTYDGAIFSQWAGTKLVMKEDGYPTSPDDGTVLVDNTTRDKYKTTGFTKDGLTNDKQYYFVLFPYSTDGVYNYDSGNRLLGEPTEEFKIVTFAGGTDGQIAKMIQAHYDNQINIADYWAVGDMRSVSLSAMSATGVGESHRAQDVQFVIGDFDHDDLETPINGHTKAAVTILQKDCLMDASNASNPVNGLSNSEKGYMNSSNLNSGGWKNCSRRTWCNNVFFAALPSAWQSMVKTVNKKSGTGGSSSSGTAVTTDKIFLASEIEIFGSTTYSVSGEGAQYQYYKNAKANRYKMPKYTSSSVTLIYWERSTVGGGAQEFCTVHDDGSQYYSTSSSAYGIAPCLCI